MYYAVMGISPLLVAVLFSILWQHVQCGEGFSKCPEDLQVEAASACDYIRSYMFSACTSTVCNCTMICGNYRPCFSLRCNSAK